MRYFPEIPFSDIAVMGIGWLIMALCVLLGHRIATRKMASGHERAQARKPSETIDVWKEFDATCHHENCNCPYCQTQTLPDLIETDTQRVKRRLHS